ncbi:MAG: hypothetical protein ACR2GG_10535 [Gemmatimonadaceae bacterium]
MPEQPDPQEFRLVIELELKVYDRAALAAAVLMPTQMEGSDELGVFAEPSWQSAVTFVNLALHQAFNVSGGESGIAWRGGQTTSMFFDEETNMYPDLHLPGVPRPCTPDDEA